MRALLILLGIIALPVAEIWLVVWLVDQFGWGPVLVAGAVFLGLGVAMLGRASRAWSHAIARAQADPEYLNTKFGAALGSSALLLIGGFLLITPGFITGLVGLVFVFPPTRALVRRLIGGRVDAAATARGYQRITVIEGETVVRSESTAAGEPSSHPVVIIQDTVVRSEPPKADEPGSGPVVISGEIVGPDEGPGRPDDRGGPDGTG